MRRAWTPISLMWPCCLLLACGDSSTPDKGDTDTDDVVETDTDTVVETDTDTDVVVETDTDTDTETDTEPADPCLRSPTVIEVGTGEDGFLEVTDGSTLEVVNGPQGGWHHTVSVRVDNAPAFVVFEVRIVDVASGEVVTQGDPQRVPVQLVSSPPGPWMCSGYYDNISAILDFEKLGAAPTDPDPWQVLCGREVRIEVDMEMADGTQLASDSLVVISQPDPDNGPYCVE